METQLGLLHRALNDAGVPHVDTELQLLALEERIRILGRAFELSCMNHRRRSHNARTQEKLLQQAVIELKENKA